MLLSHAGGNDNAPHCCNEERRPRGHSILLYRASTLPLLAPSSDAEPNEERGAFVVPRGRGFRFNFVECFFQHFDFNFVVFKKRDATFFGSESRALPSGRRTERERNPTPNPSQDLRRRAVSSTATHTVSLYHPLEKFRYGRGRRTRSILPLGACLSLHFDTSCIKVRLYLPQLPRPRLWRLDLDWPGRLR